ncbi:MAG TPA: aspartate:alanine exchanger family transporter [Herpetosiphonaceae bacterium]
MINLLIAQPLLLLFVIAGLGYFLGRIRVGGSSLGVAAVLFVGLGFGALHPDLKIPDIVYQLGLALFVYTIGLSSGPVFMGAFRGPGRRTTLLTVGMISLAALLTIGLHAALGLTAPTSAGLFAGSLTNTPALASVLDYLGAHSPAALRDQLLAEPVVAYSLGYPVSVLVMILALAAFQRRPGRAKADAEPAAGAAQRAAPLEQRTIRVTSQTAAGKSVAELMRANGWDVVFGRIRQGRELALVKEDTLLGVGDSITAIGGAEALDQATAALGELSDDHLEFDRSAMDYRRIVVSNPKVVGHPLSALNLPRHYGAVLTRIRRGDVELLPHAATTLQLGDRVRVVARRQEMPAVAAFLGDSDRAISEIDMLSLSLGLTLGMLIGLIPFPLPGGVTIKLGMAGGPLVMALLLGALHRSGPIVWTLPFSANLVLRQLGLICFLAGIGTRAGYAFLTTVSQGAGWQLLGASALVAGAVAGLTLWIGGSLLRIPAGVLMGMLAGIQTQPATLAFALEQTGDDQPNLGYATSFPVAVITKIILAQGLLLLLG